MFALTDQLIAQNLLINNRGWLHLPDFRIRFDDREAALWQQAEPLFASEAWWVRDLAVQLGCDEELMRQTLRKAAQSGDITAIVKDRYYSHDSADTLCWHLSVSVPNSGLGTRAGDFRDQLGTGRKLAVQILEYFRPLWLYSAAKAMSIYCATARCSASANPGHWRRGWV